MLSIVQKFVQASLILVGVVFVLAVPTALHASSITYNLVLTGNTASDFSGTGSFTIASAPVASGVSTYQQSAPATIEALSFVIDGQTFTLAGASHTIIQFTNGVLTDITFSEEIGSSPYRFALHTTAGYAFYYNNEQAVSYGTFTATPASTASPVPEPASIALLGTGLLGGAITIRRFGTRRDS